MSLCFKDDLTIPGEVCQARDTKLGRDVALKVLPTHLATSKERIDRFEREARLLASLNHPNVATLHGLEEHDGTKFLVMELVEGETLAARIARGPLGWREALPLFEQVAEGDGHWLAFVSDESGRAEVYIAPHPGPGGKRPVSTEGGMSPIWNPRGGELFYRNGDELMAVDVGTDGGLRLGKPRLLFERASLLPAFDVTPNGERFVMVDVSQAPELPTKLILV